MACVESVFSGTSAVTVFNFSLSGLDVTDGASATASLVGLLDSAENIFSARTEAHCLVFGQLGAMERVVRCVSSTPDDPSTMTCTAANHNWSAQFQNGAPNDYHGVVSDDLEALIVAFAD